MIIRLCLCKGWMHIVKVLKSKSHCKTTKTFSIFLQVTFKWQYQGNIWDEMCEQYLSEWCHMWYWNRGQWAWRIYLNDHRHGKLIHVFNCITLHTARVHMIEILEIAYGTSRKSRRGSWIRNGEDVELYFPTTREMIYIPSIATRKRGNEIAPCHFSLR
jgi:hypothetical protein